MSRVRNHKKLVLPLAFLLTLAQTGISLHLIYCFCLDEWKAGFFQVADQCPGMEAPTASCCSASKVCAPQPDHDCTSDEVVYLHPDHTAVSPGLISLLDFTPDHCDTPTPPLTSFFPVSLTSSLSDFPDKGPPPRSGRAIRRHLQSFLC